MDIEYFDTCRGDLEQWLRDRALPEASDVTLTPLEPASSGFSNVTLFTNLTWRAEKTTHHEELVLRCQSPGPSLFPDYDMRLQYDVMAALQPTTIPVADVKWFVDDATVLGSEGYFMARVDGAVASGFRPGFHGHGLFFDADIASRRSMWFAAVDVMADLHRLDVSALDLPETLGTDMLATIEDQLDSVSAETPVLRQALEYLRAAAPHDVDTVLCWGDARPGNIIYRGGEVAAVLDWELAHYGSPEDDLAYFLLVDEVVAELHNVPRLAGLPDPGETIAHYEARLGRTVNNLEYHRVLQALRMAAMLVLTVKLSPPELVFPPNYLDENIPTRRLAELLRSAG